jgi:hypothetical protein
MPPNEDDPLHLMLLADQTMAFKHQPRRQAQGQTRRAVRNIIQH